MPNAIDRDATRIAMTIPRALILVLVAAAVCCATASAETHVAASGSQPDVLAMLTTMQDGDTGVIPAGTWHWTSGFTWTAPANAVLLGAGDLSVLGGGDATVIVDDSSSGSALLVIIAHASGFRLAGLTMRGGTGALKDNGVLILRGPSAKTRLDHLHFDVTTYSPLLGGAKPLWVDDGVFGVLDHSIFDLYAMSAPYFFNGVGANGQANESWAAPTRFGSADYYFLEDNLFRGTEASPIRIGDSYNGSRVVWRFNTIQGGSGMEVHATGHAGDGRGHRSQEGYGNHFVNLGAVRAYDLADVSSGTAMIWGNVADTETVTHVIIFNVTRKNNATYAQVPPPDGWGYCGTAFTGVGSMWDGNADVATGYPCLDQPGRGQGDLLTGSFPSKINTRTGTAAWPNQALEPIYIWSNSAVPHPAYGGMFYMDATGGRVQADRDYYPQASGMQTSPSSPFDGTTGTGWGTLANRPATCTIGVGYFATDQGDWNKSTSNPLGVQQNGADGQLYTCTATNTWTLAYTPYTYPHPLASGVADPPGGVAQDSAFISQSFPAQMTAGTTAAVSVTMRNTGTATWIRSQGYRLGAQSPADNITWGAYRAELPGDIAPGGTATISFTITAPSTPGSYGFQWRMLQESVAWFGASSANVAIPVIADGGSGGSATFIAADTVTQGNWQGTYGADGHQLFLDATALPSYAQVSVADASYWNWDNATSDVRALQRPSDSSRIAACAYSNGSFSIDVNLTDGQSHRVALYAVDWDSNGVRSQVVEVLDTAGKVLDSRAIGPFTNGTWFVWNLQGHVVLRLTNAAGQWNAVASGLFFGGAGGDVVVAPAITQGPGDASVQAGHPATFSVAASGTSPSFQWQVAIAGSNAFANITGATASSYTTPATVGSDSGKRYRCSASNSAGSVASAAATLTVMSDQPPSSQPVLINFQPAAAAIPAGYLVDSGARFAARGNGQTYGWNKIVSTTDCNSVRSPDQRYDTFSAMQRNTWEIALANGDYSVRIVAGDANAASGSYRISAEGVLVVNGSITSSSRWLDTTATVHVNDGRLTLKGGSTGTKICFVEIVPVPAGNG